jgi:RecA/RadA recombinase
MGAALELAELRAKIRALEGGASVRRLRPATGIGWFDELLGGLPRPGIVELSGPEGSGRARAALLLAARHTARGEPVVWVDPLRRLFPPGALGLGVDLDHLLVVRPVEDGSAPWAWAAEQLLRSGCFPLVVLDLPPLRGMRRAAAHGFARAVEHGGCTLVAITGRQVRELPADVRLSTGAGQVTVVRDRGRDPLVFGRTSAALPVLPAAAEPFPDPAG